MSRLVHAATHALGPRRTLLVAALLAALATPTRLQAQTARFHALVTGRLGEDLTCVGISHRDPNFVMVGTSTGTLLRSTDGGATWQRVVITPSRTLYFGRERQPDPRFEYALGLPGKSPHLQSWIRQKGLHTSGVNWQQLLVTKGDKMVSVNWIEVDWHDENRVFVATTDGLYRSTDKARTFVRIYQGRSSVAERVVSAVATDPADPQHLLIGTASGVFDSKDRGTTYIKTMDYFLRSSYIREIWFDPQQQGLIHVAAAGYSVASPDGGKNWITTHWHGWGPRADVQSISLGPENLRVMGTRDGVWASWQGGEMGSWQRRGVRFVGTVVFKVLVTADPKVWYILTDEAVWGTQDFGANWTKVMQLGGSERPRWIRAFRGREDEMWLVTNRQVYRTGMPRGLLSMRPPHEPAAPARLLDVPPLHQFHVRVLERAGVYFPDVQRYRDRSPWAALLPYLTVGAHYTRNVDHMDFHDWLYARWPYHYLNDSADRGLSYEVLAYWELGRLVFDRRELPHWGRVDRNLAGVRRDLTERVQRLYREYVRVARILVRRPPSSALTRSFMKIRLQEITAYFDALSGGYWSKKTGGL